MEELENRLNNLERKMGEIEKKLDLLLSMVMSDFEEDEVPAELPDLDERRLGLN